MTTDPALPTNQTPGFEVTLLTKKCRIQLGGPGSLQLTNTLLLEPPQFLGHRKKTQLGACSPDVLTDPPLLSNFVQRVCGCANAVFRTAAPSMRGGFPCTTPVGPGALGHPKFDWGGPG